MNPILIARAVLIPALAVIPLYAAFMALTQKIENGHWSPGPIRKMPRALAFAYTVCVVLHFIYGSVVFLLWRTLGFQSMGSWVACYLALPLLLAVSRSNTRTGVQDALIHVGFAAVVAAATWPFLFPLFRPQS